MQRIQSIGFTLVVASLAGIVSCASLAKDPAPKEAKTSTPAKSNKAAKSRRTNNAKLSKVVSGFQKKWKAIQHYQVDYQQSVTSKTLGITDKTQGTLYIKKPDKFRWDVKGNKSSQIINNNELIHIEPKAQRGKTVVNIYKDVKKRIDLKFIQFLAGTLDLTKHYRFKLLKQTKTVKRIQFTSKKKPKESYVAEIDGKGYVLLALEFESDDSRTRMEFLKDSLDQKVKIPDSKFQYKRNSNDIVYTQ